MFENNSSFLFLPLTTTTLPMLQAEYERLQSFLINKTKTGNGCYPANWSKTTHNNQRRALRQMAEGFTINDNGILFKIHKVS